MVQELKDIKLNILQVLILLATVAGGVFTAGVVYAGHQAHAYEISVLEERLDKKIKVINENSDRIHELEVKLAMYE